MSRKGEIGRGLQDLSRRLDIQRYITKRGSEVAAHTVQKELNTLKHLLGLGVDWEIIPFNPAYKVKAPKIPPGRVRYLQPTELKLLIEGSLSWLRPIIALAASTGMRRSEIVGLRWMDLDLVHDRIMFHKLRMEKVELSISIASPNQLSNRCC